MIGGIKLIVGGLGAFFLGGLLYTIYDDAGVHWAMPLSVFLVGVVLIGLGVLSIRVTFKSSRSSTLHTDNSED